MATRAGPATCVVCCVLSHAHAHAHATWRHIAFLTTTQPHAHLAQQNRPHICACPRGCIPLPLALWAACMHASGPRTCNLSSTRPEDTPLPLPGSETGPGAPRPTGRSQRSRSVALAGCPAKSQGVEGSRVVSLNLKHTGFQLDPSHHTCLRGRVSFETWSGALDLSVHRT